MHNRTTRTIHDIWLAAWQQVKTYYLEEETLPIHPLEYEIFDSFLEPMLHLLAESDFSPDYSPLPAYYIEEPKADGSTRTKVWFGLEDEVRAHAWLLSNAEDLEGQITGASYGYRLEPSFQGRLAFSPWQEKYHEYARTALSFLNSPDTYTYVVADIRNFYPSVEIGKLYEDVSHYAQVAPEFLKPYLEFQTEDVRTGQQGSQVGGLPQGPPWARVLANLYLTPVDSLLETKSCGYVRYVDDMCILFDSTESAHRTLNSLKQTLGVFDLHLNQAKTTDPLPIFDSALLRRRLNEVKYNVLNLVQSGIGRESNHIYEILEGEFLAVDDIGSLSKAVENINYVMSLQEMMGLEDQKARISRFLTLALEAAPVNCNKLIRIFQRLVVADSEVFRQRLTDEILESDFDHIRLAYGLAALRSEETLAPEAVRILNVLLEARFSPFIRVTALAALVRQGQEISLEKCLRFLEHGGDYETSAGLYALSMHSPRTALEHLPRFLRVSNGRLTKLAALLLLYRRCPIPEMGTYLELVHDGGECSNLIGHQVMEALCLLKGGMPPRSSPFHIEPFLAQIRLDNRQGVLKKSEFVTALTTLSGASAPSALPDQLDMDLPFAYGSQRPLRKSWVEESMSLNFISKRRNLTFDEIESILEELHARDLVGPHIVERSERDVTVRYQVPSPYEPLCEAILESMQEGERELLAARVALNAREILRVLGPLFIPHAWNLLVDRTGSVKVVFVVSTIVEGSYITLSRQPFHDPSAIAHSNYLGRLLFEILSGRSAIRLWDYLKVDPHGCSVICSRILRKACHKREAFRYVSMPMLVEDLTRLISFLERAPYLKRRRELTDIAETIDMISRHYELATDTKWDHDVAVSRWIVSLLAPYLHQPPLDECRVYRLLAAPVPEFRKTFFVLEPLYRLRLLISDLYTLVSDQQSGLSNRAISVLSRLYLRNVISFFLTHCLCCARSRSKINPSEIRQAREALENSTSAWTVQESPRVGTGVSISVQKESLVDFVNLLHRLTDARDMVDVLDLRDDVNHLLPLFLAYFTWDEMHVSDGTTTVRLEGLELMSRMRPADITRLHQMMDGRPVESDMISADDMSYAIEMLTKGTVPGAVMRRRRIVRGPSDLFQRMTFRTWVPGRRTTVDTALVANVPRFEGLAPSIQDSLALTIMHRGEISSILRTPTSYSKALGTARNRRQVTLAFVKANWRSLLLVAGLFVLSCKLTENAAAWSRVTFAVGTSAITSLILRLNESVSDLVQDIQHIGSILKTHD